MIHSTVNGQIVLGECLKHLFEGYVKPSRLYAVPNGKDIDVTPVVDKDKRQNLRVLFLGNMIRTKGVMDVIQAIPQVKERIPNIEFAFAGNWNEADLKVEVEEFLEQNPGLPVELLGSVTGAAKYETIQASDLLVFPTYYPPEGHPWVIVECMACGLPVVSTDQGAVIESVIHGENGLIVEKQSPASVAEAIIQILSSDELREKMAKESRRLYLENFTEAKSIEKLIFAFRSVIGN